MKFLDKIKQYIESHSLLHTQDKYIVALSGGADSTALLLIMHQLGYHIEAAHCNFKLRGAESDHDEKFCTDLCANHQIPIHIVHFDTRSYAAFHKQSIELAARHLRYSYFEQLRTDIHADAILVAHHQDDNVETILMNLLRGTGLHGMTGIHPHRDNIIRPLLCVSRNEIENYLQQQEQSYVTDSTNLLDDVTRNKIRLNLIPQLLKINANAVDNILSTARHLSQAEEYIQTKTLKSETLTDTDTVDTTDITEYELYLRIKRFGFNPKVIEEVYSNKDNGTGQVYSNDQYELLIDRGHVLIQPITPPMQAVKIPETGNYVIPVSDNSHQELRLSVSRMPINSDFIIPRGASKIAVDADKVKFPLMLRTAKEGDRFRPFGMRGTKLVSDYLTDRKRNLFDKRSQLVLEDKEGEILWLVCERPSDNCRITKDSKQALIIEMTKKDSL